MISEYRYSLEKGSKKNNCPNCNKKTFVRYVDTKTSEFLPYQYGRCDRESKCNYYLNPYKNGYVKQIVEQEKGYLSKISTSFKPHSNNSHSQAKLSPVYFDLETFKITLDDSRYVYNTFKQNLLYNVQFPFEIVEVNKVFELYQLGTVIKGSWKSAITFPFIDKNGFVRAVQVKKFDNKNNTVAQNKLDKVILSGLKKDNIVVPEWLSKHIEYGDKYGYFTCLFGEHLLNKYPNNPIALVEAPKTAIYGTLYFGLPNKSTDLIWLAVYNKSSLSFDKIKVLQGRKILVFPDLSINGSTFKEWENKIKDFEKNLSSTKFIFSDLLEKIAPDNDRIKGNDLADYLIKLDWRKFRKTTPQAEPKKFIDLLPRKECLPVVEVTKPNDLLQYAINLIGYNNAMRKNQIPYFEELKTKGIILQAKPHIDIYYLNNSVPF